MTATAAGEAKATAAARRLRALERAIGRATTERVGATTSRWLKDLLTLDLA